MTPPRRGHSRGPDRGGAGFQVRVLPPLGMRGLADARDCAYLRAIAVLPSRGVGVSANTIDLCGLQSEAGLEVTCLKYKGE